MLLRSLLVVAVLVAGVFAAVVLAGIWRPAPAPSASSTRVTAPRQSPAGGPVRVYAADPGRGRVAYATSVSTERHGGHRQSWGAVQAASGLLYVANTHGVLEHDGASWRLLPTDLGLIRTVAIDSLGRLLAGGEKGLATFRPDSVGVLRAHTLVSSDSLGGAVWGVFSSGGRTVLQTFEQLAELDGDRVVSRVLAPGGQRFHKAFSVGGRLLVRLEGAGLLEYRSGELRPVPGGGAFAEQPVRALFDLDGAPGGALLAVTDDTLLRLDGGGTAEPIPSAAADVLREGRAYHGCRLGDGSEAAFAITTIGQGVVVVDGDGRLVQRFGAEVGLTADDLVLGCTADAQGGLWLALSDGLLRLDVVAPFSTFGADEGVPGALYDIVRHDGHLYVGTERGVFRQTLPRLGAVPRFERVAPGQGIDQVWALVPTPDGLLAASTDGVFVVDGLEARRVMDGPAYTIDEGDGWLVGLKGNVRALTAAGGWRDAGLVAETEAEVRAIATAGGLTWVMEREGRLLRVDGTRVEALGTAEGIPADIATVDVVDDALLLMSRSAAYRADARTLGRGGRVELDEGLTAYAQRVAGGMGEAAYYTFGRDALGRVWLSGRGGTVALEAQGGDWEDVTPPPLRALAGVLPVYVEGEVTYVGTSEGLFRLVGDGSRYGVAGQVLARSVTAEDDGVIYGGGDASALDAPYGQALRFGFALPAFNDPEGTQYRSFLDGFDRRPSEWSGSARRDYTNLPPGDYTFRVEARTAQGAEAQPAAVAFTIPPPWYLTPWAIVGYVLLAVACVAAIAGLASRSERRKAAAAAARAAELAALNAQLREADRLKDDMLANTSHELRTPLTAIIGFSEILRDYPGDNPAEVRELAEHMFSGGRRLLRTVNDLLDIAQLRAGKLALQPRDVDAAAIVRAVAAELAPLASEKALAFTVHPRGLVVPARLDPDALARVLINLVSNAIKFTERGGVALFVDASDGRLTISVQDSGCGIAPEFLPRLFDEYVQESTGHGRRAEGSGLGLAITRRVVDLMGGEIRVVSELDRGTRVTIELPTGTSAAPSAAPVPVEAVAAETETAADEPRRTPAPEPRV